MPWSPDWQVDLDPRLDPYRDRVAKLERDGVLAGHILVLTQPWGSQIGGHLWWRRWETRELPTVYIELADGTSTDVIISADQLDAESQSWRLNRFPWLGASLEMTWLTQDEAIAIAPDVFGVTWCLIDHGVNWSWPDEA